MSPRSRRSESGQTTVLLIGFVAVIVIAVGVAVDASAAFLHRQSLHSLADGAALHAVDHGAAGEEVYVGGLGGGNLAISEEQARAAVEAYLRDVGARRAHRGLRAHVRVDRAGGRVAVRLRAPLDLPLPVPGVAGHTTVTGLADAESRTVFE